MKISIDNWEKFEFEAMKLQYFYVWHFNNNQPGNETNALASYNAYHSMNTKKVEPKFNKNEIKSIYKLLSNIKNESKRLTKNFIRINNFTWHNLKENILMFLNVYINDPSGKDIYRNIRISSSNLQIITNICEKVCNNYDKKHGSKLSQNYYKFMSDACDGIASEK